MSEYWKSTPKYWCKFCSTFVKDTGLERKQHEATPRHQSSIQRSLRTLHKNTEREERDKQRAKDEVARLNGVVAGQHASTSKLPTQSQPPVKATADERKRQIAQLAAMGIAPPQEYTKELAVKGEWSTVSETPIYHDHSVFKQEGQDGDSKAAEAFGVRKRKLDDDELEAEAVERKGWGSKFKTYPGAKAAANDDLDALLTTPIIKKRDDIKPDPESKVKSEHDPADVIKSEESIDGPSIAAVPDVESSHITVKTEGESSSSEVKTEEADTKDVPVVFKKRKGKR